MHIDPPESWLTLTWIKSDFEIDHSRSKGTCSDVGSMRQTQWCHCHFHIFHIRKKKVIKKNHLCEKWQVFLWWPLEPKLLTLGQIWLKNVTGAWRELSNAFLWILPSYHTFGDKSNCKNHYLHKIWPSVTCGDLNIDMTWKWPPW